MKKVQERGWVTTHFLDTVVRCLVGIQKRDVTPVSVLIDNVNDPSAGSPTETLLRLLLPLNDQV